MFINRLTVKIYFDEYDISVYYICNPIPPILRVRETDEHTFIFNNKQLFSKD